VTFLRDYLFALRTSTRVPVAGVLAHWSTADDAPPPTSSAHLPGVGWFVGIAGCAAFALVGLALPPNPLGSLIAAIASTAVTCLLTGGMNERAFSQSVERGAAQLGPFALMLLALAKLALLALIAVRSPAAVLAALLAGHVVSRFWPLILGRPATHRTLVVGGAWCVAALAVMVLAQGWAGPVLALIMSAAGWWLSRRWLASRSAMAIDPSAPGAMQQACEVAFLLGAAIGAGMR
jgi:adenosylcobinamide-GDP ribazoletransferase